MEWSKTRRYRRVADEDSEDSVETGQAKQSFFTKLLVTHMNLGFFFVNLLLLAFTIWLYTKQNSPTWMLKEINTYSPILEEFKFSLHKDDQEFASLFNDPYSIYKAAPSPEVDAAWEALAETPPIALSKEQIIKLGKDPEYAVKLPKDLGYEEDTYAGALEGQHLIHCLDSLRKFAHYDYYYQAQWGSQIPARQIAHRSHCLGLLLDSLRCQPNINVATFNWVEGLGTPFANYKTQRNCQNSDDLFAWIKARGDGRGKEAWDFERPEGARQMPAPVQLLEIIAGNRTV